MLSLQSRKCLYEERKELKNRRRVGGVYVEHSQSL